MKKDTIKFVRDPETGMWLHEEDSSRRARVLELHGTKGAQFWCDFSDEVHVDSSDPEEPYEFRYVLEVTDARPGDGTEYDDCGEVDLGIVKYRGEPPPMHISPKVASSVGG